MFKKNPNRPPITVSLKRTSQGYRVVPNELYQLFQTKKIIRSIYRPDLIQMSNQNIQGPNNSNLTSGTMIQPPLHVTIPTVASWFNQNQVHSIQIQSFPQFFKSQIDHDKFSFSYKNTNLYLYYRNSMLTMWRQNAKKYLSPSLCRKNLLGDVSSIMRVHAFLENWGLINFPSREHQKGRVIEKSEAMNCYVCEIASSKVYYVAQIQDVLFQICQDCFEEDIFPQQLKKSQFKRVYLQNHLNSTSTKQLQKVELIRLLQLMSSIPNNNSKDKDIWSIIQKQFPQYSKQQLLKAFLKLPLSNQMNSNIFENNQDILSFENKQIKKQIEEIQQPSVFEDYENPILGSVAMNYFIWKKHKQSVQIGQVNSKYQLLDSIFTAIQRHAKYLAKDQQNKIIELTKMLIEVVLSKLQLKNLFIAEYEKLILAEQKMCLNIVKNTLSENLKQNLRVLKMPQRQSINEQKIEQINNVRKLQNEKNMDVNQLELVENMPNLQ